MLKAWDKEFIWHPFTQMQDWARENPLVVERGEGVYLEDSDGRRYIDGVASLWTNVHGHQKKEIDEAIRDQLTRIGHSTMLGLTHAPAIELARRLIEIAPTGLSRVFYSDNGATSCEIALKMAFQYWQQQGKTKKTSFVYFENSYHGDTLGAVSVGGIDMFHHLYHPLLFHAYRSTSPYCYRCPYQLAPAAAHGGPPVTPGIPFGPGSSPVNPAPSASCRLRCLQDLERILKERAQEISALIIEPCVQGAGGILVAPDGFLRRVRDLCSQYQVLMICDEVAVGFGRTGRMFACEHEQVHPDLLCLAKGITGGYLPLAVTLASEQIFAGFLGDYSQKRTFFHGHTYTGNPLACRAALANLDIFEKERLVEKVQEKSVLLTQGLREFRELPHVGDIRQKGLMAGIELVRDKISKEPYGWEEKMGIRVIQEARKMGVILRPLGDVIVLMPPLSISAAELDQLLSVTLQSIRQVTEGGED
ncbi:MAG: adenosylmethionine--8-amino-7-oxononanoate transaminase [bacterium]